MKAAWVIYEPSVIFIPKPDTDNIRKENYSSILLMKGP